MAGSNPAAGGIDDLGLGVEGVGGHDRDQVVAVGPVGDHLGQPAPQPDRRLR